MIITNKALPRRTFLRGVGTRPGLAGARCDGSGFGSLQQRSSQYTNPCWFLWRLIVNEAE